MNKSNILYEGKCKSIYKTNNPHEVILFFKDDITAHNSKKKEIIKNKGRINKAINSILFKKLSEKKIKTHFIKDLNENEILTKKLSMIPIEVVIRNIATGSLIKRIGIPDKTILKNPIIEFFYKKDELNDPLINRSHISFLNLATDEDLNTIIQITIQINDFLKDIFNQINLTLVDLKVEFGKDQENQIYLGDEITPDSCRLWEKSTQKIMDKDVFRNDLDDILTIYEEVYTRLKKVIL